MTNIFQERELKAASLTILIATLMTGCGGGSGGNTLASAPNDGSNTAAPEFPGSPLVIPPVMPDPVPEVASQPTLLERLQTVPLGTSENIYYWACDSSRRSNTVAYLFGTPRSEGSGVTVGSWASGINISAGTFAQREIFTVIGNTDDSLLLDYEILGIQEDITSIAFVTNFKWTGFSTTEGSLNCDLIESRRSKALTLDNSERARNENNKLAY